MFLVSTISISKQLEVTLGLAAFAPMVRADGMLESPPYLC